MPVSNQLLFILLSWLLLLVSGYNTGYLKVCDQDMTFFSILWFLKVLIELHFIVLIQLYINVIIAKVGLHFNAGWTNQFNSMLDFFIGFNLFPKFSNNFTLSLNADKSQPMFFDLYLHLESSTTVKDYVNSKMIGKYKLAMMWIICLKLLTMFWMYIYPCRTELWNFRF